MPATYTTLDAWLRIATLERLKARKSSRRVFNCKNGDVLSPKQQVMSQSSATHFFSSDCEEINSFYFDRFSSILCDPLPEECSRLHSDASEVQSFHLNVSTRDSQAHNRTARLHGALRNGDEVQSSERWPRYLVLPYYHRTTIVAHYDLHCLKLENQNRNPKAPPVLVLS